MNLEKKILNLFNEKISIFILFFVCILTIVISNYLYEYEEALSLQDASEYIALANDLNSYFTLPHQGALRIFPSFLVFCLSIIGISVEMGFKYLTYFFFIFLNFKLFYLLKDFNLKNYLVLPSIAILIYSNHSVIYTVFNYYQLIDLFTYIFILYFIQLLKKTNIRVLFIVSLLSIFTKEYLIVLVIFVYWNSFYQSKNNYYLINLFIIIFIFIFHYNLASSETDAKDYSNVYVLSSSYLMLFGTFHQSLIEGLIHNKNILLFMPFGLLIFSKLFLKILIKNYPILIFSLIPLGFSIFLFDKVGNNFFRVYYHGYFIIIFYAIIFINEKISQSKVSCTLYFISPIFFLIDLFYITFNINQSGFFNYFQIDRYDYFSGFYLFNLIFFVIFLINYKKIFYVKKN